MDQCIAEAHPEVRVSLIIIIILYYIKNDVHMGRENMKMKRNEIVQRGGGAEGRCVKARIY